MSKIKDDLIEKPFSRASIENYELIRKEVLREHYAEQARKRKATRLANDPDTYKKMINKRWEKYRNDRASEATSEATSTQ